MARKPATDQLIHCNACGEDYSSTYRRCPFCGERVNARPADTEEDFDDGYVFDGQAMFDDPEDDSDSGAPKGGRRLAAGNGSGSSSRGRFDSTPPVNWGRLITYGISLIIIIAALVILFTVFYPMIHSNPDPSPSPSGSTSVEPSNPVESPDPVPPTDPVDEPTDPVDEPSVAPGLKGITLSTYDFTLVQNESHRILVTLDPEDWDGELTWTSSDESYATVDSTGKVTNVNTSSSLRRVTITVSAGDVSANCTVYCRGVTAVDSPPPVSTDDPVDQPSSGNLAPGTVGYIVGASGGLRVRSGPGTTYNVQASLVNGNEVTVLEDAGNGWYRISYGGNGTGYIMGDFIQVK